MFNPQFANATMYGPEYQQLQNMPQLAGPVLPVSPTMNRPIPVASPQMPASGGGGQPQPSGGAPAAGAGMGPEANYLAQIQKLLGTLQNPNMAQQAAQYFGANFEPPNTQGFGQIPPPNAPAPQQDTAAKLGALISNPQQMQQQGMTELLRMLGGAFNPTSGNAATKPTW